MAKTVVFSGQLLGLILNGVSIPGLADNAASPLNQLYVSLHDNDPGPAGTQRTSETNYGGYTRAVVARTSGVWVVTGSVASPVNPIVFPPCTAGLDDLGFFGIGTNATGNGRLLYSGVITPVITVVTGYTPLLTAASTLTES